MMEVDDPLHLINRKSGKGMTPLYLAAKHGNLNVVKLLMERRADYLLENKVR